MPDNRCKTSLDFVAIDFETANYKSTSACAVGLAVVSGGEVAETFTALIKPEPFWFVPDFIDIHNIRPGDVENSPDFASLWPEIKKRIKGLSLLAHNAPFDRGVLKACLRFYGIKFPQPEFICTVRLAREAHPDFPNHKLNTVCREMGIELEHHKAESDALACAKIALEIFKARELDFSPGRLKKTEW